MPMPRPAFGETWASCAARTAGAAGGAGGGGSPPGGPPLGGGGGGGVCGRGTLHRGRPPNGVGDRRWIYPKRRETGKFTGHSDLRRGGDSLHRSSPERSTRVCHRPRHGVGHFAHRSRAARATVLG